MAARYATQKSKTEYLTRSHLSSVQSAGRKFNMVKKGHQFLCRKGNVEYICLTKLKKTPEGIILYDSKDSVENNPHLVFADWLPDGHPKSRMSYAVKKAWDAETVKGGSD